MRWFRRGPMMTDYVSEIDRVLMDLNKHSEVPSRNKEKEIKLSAEISQLRDHTKTKERID